MYEKYYSSKREVIIDGLKKWKNEKKSIAVWSAGRRGGEFLQICDATAQLIDCVFDIDINKCGEVLPTGHKVEDYRSAHVDIVIFIDPVYTNESIMQFRMVNKYAHVCCLENVIFGDIPLTKFLYWKNDRLCAKKRNNIFSLTILYNPSANVVENIKTYLSFVDKLIIYDNSKKNNCDILADLIKNNRVKYIWGDGVNKGIGSPINEVVENLPVDKDSWLITFDQDSEILPDTILEMRNYVESEEYDETVGVVAPLARNLLKNKFSDEEFKNLPYLTYKQEVMQSGAMHRLDILCEIGGYNDELFIDQVDLEYCARCRVAGYKIVQLNRVFMLHQTEDENHVVYSEGKNILVDKYSPERFYYQIRNQLYLARKYRKIDPIYSEECMRGYKNLIKFLKFESEKDEKTRLLKKAEKDAELGILGKI